MTKTIICPSIEQEVVGYMLNSALSLESQHTITEIQQLIANQFGTSIWMTPKEALHTTLFDWIAPLVDYGEDKDTLFEEIYEKYDEVVTKATTNIGPISIRFDTISAGPAAIFITGHDNGTFEQIRKEFLDNVTLLPNTKLPPTIIHTTIGRFTQEIDLELVQSFIQSLSIEFKEHILAFRLVKETLDPMLDFQQIKTYSVVG